MSALRGSFVFAVPLVLALAAPAWSEPPADPAKPAAEEKQPNKEDLYGDPLPPNALVRMGTVRLRHPGVAAVAFSRDGQMLASASHGGPGRIVRIWEVCTGKQLNCLACPNVEGVRCLAFSPNAKQLLLGCEGGQICLWDRIADKEIRRFDGLTEAICSVVFSPDAELVAVGWSLDLTNLGSRELHRTGGRPARSASEGKGCLARALPKGG